MAGDNVEDLCAKVATLGLTQPTGETRSEDKSINEPSSTISLEQPKITGTRRVIHSCMEQSARSSVHPLTNTLVKPRKSPNSTNENTATNNSTRTRKDSHSGDAHNESAKQLSEMDMLKSEIERLKQQNEDLKQDVEKHKVELESAYSEKHNLEGRMEKKEAELAACRKKLEFTSSYGTEKIGFSKRTVRREKICFRKVCDRASLSTTVTLEANFEVKLSKTLIFAPKIFRACGNEREDNDKGAVALMYVSGKLQAAKCGREQHSKMFIEKNRWTEAVKSLSKMIGLELEQGYAQHAELQLIAFYLGQVFETSRFEMVGIENPEAYQACPQLIRPVTIYVDQEVCRSCSLFVDKINEITNKYRLKFTVTNTGQTEFIN